jgi:hypothetical protein
MDQELKDKWLKALRSKEYRGKPGLLKTSNDEYSCIGVLADLLVQEGKASWGESYARTHGLIVLRYKGEQSGSLPYELLDQLSQFKIRKLENDGATFSQLADWIELAVVTDEVLENL